jgi:hypothetical protein
VSASVLPRTFPGELADVAGDRACVVLESLFALFELGATVGDSLVIATAVETVAVEVLGIAGASISVALPAPMLLPNERRVRVHRARPVPAAARRSSR